MNDLISRQALCEYALNQKDKSVMPNDIMRFPHAEQETCVYWDRESNFCALHRPSAEPEIIYCKDCVHNKSKADAGNALCELYYGMTDQMGYCHKGERRE